MSAGTDAAGPSLAARFGVPQLSGRGRMVSAVLIDTLGVGLMLPVTLLYFTLVTNIPVAVLGILLSAAMLASLPLGPIGGELVHRFGAKRVMIGNNLISAVGYLFFYLADAGWTVFTAAFLVAVSERMFWACWPTYLVAVSDKEHFGGWFAFIESLKAACMAAGSFLAAVLLTVGGNDAVRWLVVLNIASCLTAAVIFGRQPVREVRSERGQSALRAWREVLRDRRYLLLSVGQLLTTPVGLLSAIAFPVFYIQEWGLPSWIAPALFTLGAVLTFLFQTSVTHRLRHAARSRVLLGSAALSCAAMLVMVVFTTLGRPSALVGAAVGVVVDGTLAFAGILFFPTSNSLLMAVVDEHNSGRVTALFHTGTAIAIAASPALMSALLTWPDVLWCAMAALALSGAACFVTVARRERADR